MNFKQNALIINLQSTSISLVPHPPTPFSSASNALMMALLFVPCAINSATLVRIVAISASLARTLVL